MTTLYPLGYDGPDEGTVVDQFGTIDDVALRLAKAHPEFRRRVLAAVTAANGLVGIGGGWRSTEAQTQLFLSRYHEDPNGSVVWNGKRWSKNPGVASAAPPGSSFHESQTFASGVVGFQAVDIVGVDGNTHDDAWAWIHQHGPEFGLKDFTNVNSEPWHIQCAELPNGVASWIAAGRPDPIAPTPEEPVAVSYFKTDAKSLTIWATADGLNAVRLEEFTVEARGVDVFSVPVLAAGEADKYVFQAGLTAQSVR